jgi:hypothetical protein
MRWTWLWSVREDVTWNLVPFWLGLALGVFLLTWWQVAAWAHWHVKFPEAATQARFTGLVMYLYGPLIDAPHLWATIARTYTDAAEWTERRRLFLGSLVWFFIGPIAILLPYALRAMSLYPAGHENLGWTVWSQFFTFYALYHINKQHWGFVSLYRRKNGEATSEYQIDRAFFTTAIWLPYAAWLTAPWYLDFDGAPLYLTRIAVGGTTLGHVAHLACHVLFIAVCLAYAGFQLRQWSRGVARNGPKLVYLATVIPIYYLAFTLNPLLAAFWVLMTGVGHCAQYHKIVWAYGTKKYVSPPEAETPSLPVRIFGNVWLYIVLGVAYGLVTLQGPGSNIAKTWIAGGLQSTMGALAPFVDRSAASDVSLKAVAAFISGVRLHHFYVDSKIWRVSHSKTLAKNLSV